MTIERYREQSLYTNEATDEQLAENLAGEIAPQALTMAGLHRPARWSVECVALPQRSPEVEVRPSDFRYDGMKAWIIRQGVFSLVLKKIAKDFGFSDT